MIDRARRQKGNEKNRPPISIHPALPCVLLFRFQFLLPIAVVHRALSESGVQGSLFFGDMHAWDNNDDPMLAPEPMRPENVGSGRAPSQGTLRADGPKQGGTD